MDYIIFVLPAIIFAMYAQSKVGSTFKRYSNVGNSKGFTGADIAKQLLYRSGINDVRVEHINGNLTDHYDPRAKVIRLSDAVYSSNSIAAIGVAAHETGHAVQHHTGYVPLNIRSSIVPLSNFGSKLAMPLIMIGFFISFMGNSFGSLLVKIGIIGFTLVVAFNIITLPVEFNASSRAIYMLNDYDLLSTEETIPAKKVLNAAALTYVASAAVAIAQLLRLILMSQRRR